MLIHCRQWRVAVRLVFCTVDIVIALHSSNVAQVFGIFWHAKVICSTPRVAPEAPPHPTLVKKLSSWYRWTTGPTPSIVSDSTMYGGSCWARAPWQPWGAREPSFSFGPLHSIPPRVAREAVTTIPPLDNGNKLRVVSVVRTAGFVFLCPCSLFCQLPRSPYTIMILITTLLTATRVCRNATNSYHVPAEASAH